MSKIYKIRVNEGAGGESQIIQITQSVNNKDAPLRIMARRGVRYELQDEANLTEQKIEETIQQTSEQTSK